MLSPIFKVCFFLENLRILRWNYNIFIMICPLFVLRLFSFSSKVREFAINDITPYPIAIEFNETSEPTKIEKTDVYVKANVIPSAKFVTFPKATNYDVRAV